MTYSINYMIGILKQVVPYQEDVKFPCGIYNTTVKINQKAVQCDSRDL